MRDNCEPVCRRAPPACTIGACGSDAGTKDGGTMPPPTSRPTRPAAGRLWPHGLRPVPYPASRGQDAAPPSGTNRTQRTGPAPAHRVGRRRERGAATPQPASASGASCCRNRACRSHPEWADGAVWRRPWPANRPLRGCSGRNARMTHRTSGKSCAQRAGAPSLSMPP